MTSKSLPQHGRSTLILPYNTSALHKHEWSDKKVEWPNRELQMYKCYEPCRRECFPALMANHNGCISAHSSFMLTSYGPLHSSLNDETSHRRFITVHAHVQFCIDRKYIFKVNSSPHQPNTRKRRTNRFTSSIIVPQTMASRKKRGPGPAK